MDPDPNPKNARVTGPKCGVVEEFRRVRAQVFGGTEYVIQEFHLAVCQLPPTDARDLLRQENTLSPGFKDNRMKGAKDYAVLLPAHPQCVQLKLQWRAEMGPLISTDATGRVLVRTAF